MRSKPVSLLIVFTMATVTTKVRAMRIAIQGSGISAATCAEILNEKHDVTVFESGRGPGGRMSTRRAEPYQFDHGAQYFSPKTEAFAEVVDDWCARGLSEVWEGQHCGWSPDSGVVLNPKAQTSKWYVGTPGMNAISRGLLAGVSTSFETRAVAQRNKDGGGSKSAWKMMHGKTGKLLGEFDFLICSDKTAAANYRNDLNGEELQGFVKPARSVKSAQCLALMVATKRTNLEFDSLLLEGHPAFSWVARDDSKPGRTRSDGAECWVAHASPAMTKALLDSYKKNKNSRANAVRGAVVRDLLPHFEALVADLVGGSSPEILAAHGHRWGAAFPSTVFPSGSTHDGGPFYLDSTNAFAACGDYFSAFPGRVEGGWSSGSSLATALLRI